MKKGLKIIRSTLIVVAGLIFLLALVVFLMIAFKKEDLKFVTASFIDFEQIDSISKYRSCYGHDAGRIFNNVEPVCSLKHYVVPNQEFFGTDDEVKILAPFDGKILLVGAVHSDRGRHVFLLPKNSLWVLAFDHLNPLPEVINGYEFSAGDLIGYASTGEDNPPDPGSFDVEVGYLPQVDYGVDSVFNHMTDEVLEEFEAYGITTENMIVTREEREANPCECADEEEDTCRFRPENVYPDHAVKLEKE